MIYFNRKTRRQFLFNAGGFALALPFMPSLLPKAFAQAGPKGKRFIAIHSGHCQAVEQWYPNPQNLSWVERNEHAREVLLATIPGNLSQVLTASFNPVRSKLNLISRLDPTSSMPNHNAEVVLGGGVLSEISQTIDHVLAKKMYNGAPLNLFVKSVADSNYSGASHMSVSGGSYSPGVSNPSSVFKSLFGTSGNHLGGVDKKAIARDVSAVDQVFKELQTLKQNRRLGTEDKQRLEKHISLVQQVQTKLVESSSEEAPTKLACEKPNGPASSPVFSSQPSDYGVVIDQMFDVMEIGIRCGKVGVATLMLHVYDYFAGNVGFIPQVSGNFRFHEDIHHADSAEMRVMKLHVNRYFADRVARFLVNLNDVEDPLTGMTYLDNSLVLWGNDQGALKHTGGHHSKNQPVLLAGSAGGFLKTGKYIDYGPAYAGNNNLVGGEEHIYKRGRPYTQLLVTILQAMGLSPADYESANQQGYGVYGSNTNHYDYLAGNHRRDILPLL